MITAVKFARAHNVEVAVRSTGHNVAGISVCDGGMVIDLSVMKGIHIRSGSTHRALWNLESPGPN